MKRTIVFTTLILCVVASPSEARNRKRIATGLDPMCNVTMPCEMPISGLVVRALPRSVVRETRAAPRRMVRERFAARTPGRMARPARRAVEPSPVDMIGSGIASIGEAFSRPMRYIGGRLVCAVNVNAALAARGIRGTGSALAHSFDSWGHASGPRPGAVAVTDRRGGGHVAIVSRVEGGRVFVWNATGGRNGWHEIEYTNRHARYRVSG